MSETDTPPIWQDDWPAKIEAAANLARTYAADGALISAADSLTRCAVELRTAGMARAKAMEAAMGRRKV